MWVVKLGGSLASSPYLDAWLETLVRYGGGRAVIVPGGGPFADVVRRIQASRNFPDAVAHRMAVLAMTQYGLMLTGLQSALETADSIDGIRAVWRAGRTPVWLPAPMVFRDNTIEASWRVTSDSLAVWLADRLNAGRLALIKSIATPTTSGSDLSIEDLIGDHVVDPMFGIYAQRTRCELFLLGPDDYHDLARGLHTGSRPGVPITRFSKRRPTMTDRRQDRTYSEQEIKDRLEKELPHWYYEDGWIRRKYRTSGWKGTLMVINAVGHLAEAAWHHPDLAASYAFVIVKLMNHAAKGVTDKDFELAKKIEEVVQWQPGAGGGPLEGTPDDPRFKYIKYD